MISVREGRESFLQTIAQLTAEREAARSVVEDLRSRPTELWEREIPPQWRTAGFVQELTGTAAAILESDPRESLALAQFALAVASSIPPGTYASPVQAQLEGTAWKEIGTAHRYLSEYDAAMRAYDAAQRSFSSANSLAHDEAIVDFARAIVLTDLGRNDEALKLLRQVEPLFRSFDDQKRLVRVRLLEGAIYFKQRRLEEARATFEAALREVPLDDLHTRAMLHMNLGLACGDLQDTNDAVLNLHQARQLLIDLEMPVEVSRCEWNLAHMLLPIGEFSKAEPMLQRVRHFFLDKGMPEEAGLAGLDLADALIAMNQAEKARQLVESVLAEFTRAQLNTPAITALAYLRDLLPTTQQPRRVIRHVREYLAQLRTEPARLFLPLPEE